MEGMPLLVCSVQSQPDRRGEPRAHVYEVTLEWPRIVLGLPPACFRAALWALDTGRQGAGRQGAKIRKLFFGLNHYSGTEYIPSF